MFMFACPGVRAVHVFVMFMLSEGAKSGFDPFTHGKSLLDMYQARQHKRMDYVFFLSD